MRTNDLAATAMAVIMIKAESPTATGTSLTVEFGDTLARRSLAEECDTQGAKQHDGREEVRRHGDVFEPIPVCSKGVRDSSKPEEHSARERCA